ncbi:hypothetical protein JCM30237_11450 [Halolamina litorea]|uniref:Twin-arginine translocation signal domain-containing protein n=1 Tax=Halolamina litorea TaxID=1515593 RepID=A0ABD6BM49_9EURY|nr:twin-arginine translocation signal domain-containing protein [Halolamina litorea]
MSKYEKHTTVSDEERREFLKALGVAGAVGAAGVTVGELNETVDASNVEALSSVGAAVSEEIAGQVDAGLLADQQAELAATLSAAPATVESGAAFESPGTAFDDIAEAGWATYGHLEEAGFFESLDEHMPAFNPERLTTSTRAFLGSEAAVEPLSDLDLGGTAGVDLVAPVINQAEKLSHFHWIASGDIPAEHQLADVLPPITQRAAGGVLLWLQNLDDHLYQDQVLFDEQILADGIWEVRGMTAGFYLMTEGAKAAGTDSDRFTDAELGALFTTSIALQEVAQRMLPVHMHWIDEESRDPGNVKIDSISI